MATAREKAPEDAEPPAAPADGGAPPRGTTEPSERIRSVIRAYHRAFDAGEAAGLVPYVHRPCTVITRRGAYVLADRGEIVSAFTSVQRDLRARGCERTDRGDVRVRMLDDRLARAHRMAVRFDGDDRELERTGTTYVLRRTDEGWRIAVLVEHEAGEPPRAP